jgi:hypothetical protein
VRRIQSERRASGELVHVELTPGAVTILPAWKLDAIYCAGLKVGAPQVSLAALRTLRELLIACESRLVSADGNIVTQEAQDGSAVTTRTICRHIALTAPRQLDLVLDDVRLRAMTPAERQAVLRAMARLLLEAGGVATREVSDDNA